MWGLVTTPWKSWLCSQVDSVSVPTAAHASLSASAPHIWAGPHTGSFLVPVGFFSQNCLKKNNSIVESYMIMMSDPRSLLTRERWSRSPRNLHGSEMVLRFGQDEWQEASHQQHFSPQCHCFSPCHLHSCSIWGWYVSYSFGVVILFRYVFKWHLPWLMTWIPMVNVFL